MGSREETGELRGSVYIRKKIREMAPEYNLPERKVKVLQSEISYTDVGQGPVFILFHGNPTSKYIWRQIIPQLATMGRVISFDLLGMGQSGTVDSKIGFKEQYQYAEAFIEQLGLNDVTLVLHDWGGALGLHWAKLHSKQVKAVVLMETLTNPRIGIKDSGLLPWLLFHTLRIPKLGDWLIVKKNIFLKVLLQLGTLNRLPKNVRQNYEAPFATMEKRKCMYSWVSEIPYKNHHPENALILKENLEWLEGSSVPKLLFHVRPGFAIPEQFVKRLKARVPHLQTRYLGKGLHFVQEDYPVEIGQGILEWFSQSVVIGQR